MDVPGQEFLKYHGTTLLLAKLEVISANPCEEAKETSINYYDNYSFKLSDDKLVISFNRKLEFVPSALFFIEVSYDTTWEIVEGKNDLVEGFIKEPDDDTIDFLIGSAAEEASLLIAQLIKAMDLAPIITPPLYTPNKN